MTIKNMKPCPFCGSHVINIIGDGDVARYECDGCSASAPYCDWNDRAAAVQWVTYDGTPKTLPEPGKSVLVCINHLFRYIFIAKASCVLNFPLWHGFVGDRKKIIIGDRWAYLPEPPEVME